MLNELLNELVEMYKGRNSQTVYSGYGTTIDQMVDEYWDFAGFTSDTRRMIRHLDNMAYARAMEEQEI